jgi:hypothetical protein
LRIHFKYTKLVSADIPIPITRCIIQIPILEPCFASVIPITADMGEGEPTNDNSIMLSLQKPFRLSWVYKAGERRKPESDNPPYHSKTNTGAPPCQRTPQSPPTRATLVAPFEWLYR